MWLSYSSPYSSLLCYLSAGSTKGLSEVWSFLVMPSGRFLAASFRRKYLGAYVLCIFQCDLRLTLFAVVFLDHSPSLSRSHAHCYVCTALEGCGREHSQVSQVCLWTVLSFLILSCRKLLAIDYLGAVLTLIGCALISLPLIWVCCH